MITDTSLLMEMCSQNDLCARSEEALLPTVEDTVIAIMVSLPVPSLKFVFKAFAVTFDFLGKHLQLLMRRPKEFVCTRPAYILVGFFTEVLVFRILIRLFAHNHVLYCLTAQHTLRS